MRWKGRGGAVAYDDYRSIDKVREGAQFTLTCRFLERDISGEGQLELQMGSVDQQ